MSERTETEIKSMSKEQNYLQGYKDGKCDVLDKISSEIEEQVFEGLSDGCVDWFAAEKVNACLEIINKYRDESEGKE